MKLAGDKKTKKKILIIAIAAAVVLTTAAVIALVLSNNIKPPGPKTPTVDPDDPGNTGNPNGPDPYDPGGDGVDPEYIIDWGTEIKQDQFTMLVCGTDDDNYHTDTMMLISFDTKNKKANVLSIPRDTIIDTQARQAESKKINASYSINKRNNIELTKQDVKSILGFEPDYYMVLDLDGFEQIVNVLGGIDYELTRDYKYYDPDQDLNIDLNKGMQHLDGEKLLWLFRYRYGYPNGDIDRISVQQDLLREMIKQMMILKNIPKIPQVVRIINESFNTDMPLGELTWLANTVRQMGSEDFEFYTLPGFGETVTYNGRPVSYYFLYKTRVLELVNAKFNPFEKDITNIGVVPYSEYAAYSDAAAQQLRNNRGGTSGNGSAGATPGDGDGTGDTPGGNVGGDQDGSGAGTGDDGGDQSGTGDGNDAPVYTGDPSVPAEN